MNINTNNFNAMAEAMGMSVDAGEGKSKANTLARVRVNNTPIMGTTEIKGKKVNMEVVPAGTYRIDIPDVGIYYGETATIRPFMQRFMFQKYDSDMGKYVKTVMANSLKNDLKDNMGGFNCGKPSGYIEDFSALPKDMQDLIRQIKRVRVLFGTITLNNCTDENGDTAEVNDIPFIFEISNKESFKNVGNVFTELAKNKRLPINHYVEFGSEQRKLPSGNAYYVCTANLDLSNPLDITDSVKATFEDFITWVESYNDYVVKEFNTKIEEKKEKELDAEIYEGVVDIEIDED